MKVNWLFGAGLALLAQIALAKPVDVTFEKVADQVYAYIGEMGDRSKDNFGMNANYGLVITDKGAVLIDSGASYTAAKHLEAAATKVTKQPIVAVINTGSQDHRWLGNGYFAAKGIEIIALQRTVDTQHKEGANQISGLKNSLGDQLSGTQPITAKSPIAENRKTITIGHTEFELRYFSDAHFAGDVVVYLPKTNILFAGDHVFVDRILGVLPGHTNPKTLRTAVHEMMQAYPKATVVPGHGHICDMAKVKAENADYLDYLNDVVGKAAENMEGIDAVSAKARDLPQFKHLKVYDVLHPKNVNSTFLFYEQGN
ncbi:MAG: MBL fold metallo-hydrolase [Proteobacteria bacterium]|nr:MBL fold metallo-hydrolase [Pseudomonadota bacterium]